MNGNYVDINGQYVCVICGPYSSFSDITYTCLCNSGYVKDNDGNCVPIGSITNNSNSNSSTGKTVDPNVTNITVTTVANTTKNTTNNTTNTTNNTTPKNNTTPPNNTIIITPTINCSNGFTYDTATKRCMCKSPLF